MKKLAALFALLALAWPACAGDLWIDLNLTSIHSKPEQHLNRENYGAGIEYRSNDFLYMVGAYRNSYERTSAYALLGWAPISIWSVKMGAVLGAINGYYALNNGGFTPAFAGIVQFEGKDVGLNMVIIPPPIKNSPVTFGFQMKFRYR